MISTNDFLRRRQQGADPFDDHTIVCTYVPTEIKEQSQRTNTCYHQSCSLMDGHFLFLSTKNLSAQLALKTGFTQYSLSDCKKSIFQELRKLLISVPGRFG